MPAVASVGRFVKPSAGHIRRRIDCPRRPACSPERCVNRARMLSVERKIDCADILRIASRSREFSSSARRRRLSDKRRARGWPCRRGRALPRTRDSDRWGLRRCCPIWRVAARPIECHVLPASVDLKRPIPYECWLRISGSPVPTYTMFGSDGATAMAPMEPIGMPVEGSSAMGNQVRPAFSVFHTPPPTEPI